MDLINTAVQWISYALAAYILGTVIFLMGSMAIGAIKARSALWWYLVYSVVVVGMLLAGLQYLPSMVLQSANQGIEEAQPEIDRFAQNISGMFQTAVNTGAGSAPQSAPQNDTAVQADTVPSQDAAAAGTPDPNVGGGYGVPPTMAPQLSQPENMPTQTPQPTATPLPTSAGLGYEALQATANSRLATVEASGVTPTYDPLHPPTPEITPRG